MTTPVTVTSGTGAPVNPALQNFNPPNVISISPTHGTDAGGTSVAITGVGFTGATSVTLGGTALASFTVVNDTTITGVTAAGNDGTWNVDVATPGGTGVLAQGWTYFFPTAANATITGADVSSLVDGTLTSPLWQAPGASVSAAFKAVAGPDASGSYLDAYVVNPAGNAPSSQVNGFVFVCPTGATSLSLSMSAKIPSGGSAQTFVIGLWDTVANSLVASTSYTTTSSYATVTATLNSPTAGRAYQARIYVNNAGVSTTSQATVQITRPVVTAAGISGVLSAAYVRVPANHQTLRDVCRITTWAYGYQHTSFGRIAIETDATSIVVEGSSNLQANGYTASDASIGVWVNGRPYTTVQPPATTGAFQATVTLPSGVKKVEIVSAFDVLTANVSGYSVWGTWLRALYVPVPGTGVLRHAPEEATQRRLLISADSIGGYFCTNGGSTDSWSVMLRQRGMRVMVDGMGTLSQMEFLATDRARRQTIDQWKACGFDPTDIWIQLGGNDCTHQTAGAKQSAAILAAWLPMVAAAFPKARIFYQSTTIRPASEGSANGFGDTLAAYRSAWQPIVQALAPRVVFVDGLNILVSGDLSDGVHPLGTAQYKYANYVANKIQTQEDASYTIGTTPLLERDFNTLPIVAGGIAGGSAGTGYFARATSHRLTRASAATVQTSATTVDATPGTDTARIGDDGSGFGPALILEGAGSNLTTDPIDWSTANWAKTTLTATANNAVAPDGNTTAARGDATALTSQWRAAAVNLAAAATFIASFWVKSAQTAAATHKNGLRHTLSQIYDNGLGATIIGPTDVVMGPSGQEPVAQAAWQRVTLQPTSNSNVGAQNEYLYPVGGLLEGTGSLYGWGAQLEAGQIATELMTVARSADLFYYPAAGDITQSGARSPEYVFKPKGGSADYTGLVYLWQDPNSGTDAAWWDSSTGKISVRIGGVTKTTTNALSWNFGDVLRIFVGAGGSLATTIAWQISHDQGQTWDSTKTNIESLASLGNCTNSSGTINILHNAGSNTFVCRLRSIAYWGAGQMPAWVQTT